MQITQLAEGVPRLTLLDVALFYRPVIVSTDKASCLGTLMPLHLSKVLANEPKKDQTRVI